MATKKQRNSPRPKVCKARDCGRPPYARGLCQTHHRQVLTTGEVKPIRPYRPRTPGTVRFAGLRLSQQCAEQLTQFAEHRRISLGAAIADVLERALVKPKPPARQR